MKKTKVYNPKTDWGWATCQKCVVRFSNSKDITQKEARCYKCGGKVNDFSLLV
mgnify:CR=1